jgi:hypothetical protein
LEPIQGVPGHPSIPTGAYAVRATREGSQAQGCFIPTAGDPIPIPGDFVGELLDEETNPQTLIIGFKMWICFFECR